MNAVAGQAFDVQSVRLAMQRRKRRRSRHMFPASGDFPDAFPEVGKRLRMRRGVPEAPAGELVELNQYEPIEPNEILQHLVDLDARRAFPARRQQ